MNNKLGISIFKFYCTRVDQKNTLRTLNKEIILLFIKMLLPWPYVKYLTLDKPLISLNQKMAVLSLPSVQNLDTGKPILYYKDTSFMENYSHVICKDKKMDK